MTILTPILSIASLLGFSLMLVRLWRWQLGSSIFFVSSSLVLLLYYAALLGALSPVALFTMCTGLVFLGIHIYDTFRNQQQWLSKEERLSLQVLLLISALLWLKLHSGMLYMWDDFSHWGRIIKELYATGALPDHNSLVLFKDYPPGQALFQYFAMQGSILLHQPFSEGEAMFAQGLFIFALCFPIISQATYRDRVLLFITILFLMVILFAYGPGFRSLNADHVLGICFGITMLLYWNGKRDAQPILQITPAVAVLPLLKTIAPILVGTIFLFVLLDQFHQFLKRNKNASFPPIYRLAALLLLIIAPLLSYSSWKSHSSTFAETFNASNRISIEKVVSIIKGDLSPFESEVAKSYFSKLSPIQIATDQERISVRPNKIALSLYLLLALFIYFYRKDTEAKSRQRVAILSFSLLTGFMLYYLAHLFLYMLFPQFGGARLDSFNRYFSIFLLGWSMVAWSLLLHHSKEWNLNKNRDNQLLLVFLIVCLLFGGGGLARFLFKASDQLRDGREYVLPMVEQYRPLLTEHSKIYYVSIGIERSLSYYMAGYEAYPAQIISSKGFSISNQKRPGYYSQVSIKEWEAELADSYNYVLVGNADQNFWNDYGSMFESPHHFANGTLFKVVHKKQFIRLEPIQQQ